MEMHLRQQGARAAYLLGWRDHLRFAFDDGFTVLIDADAIEYEAFVLRLFLAHRDAYRHRIAKTNRTAKRR